MPNRDDLKLVTAIARLALDLADQHGASADDLGRLRALLARVQDGAA